jgi:hypothetical protein
VDRVAEESEIEQHDPPRKARFIVKARGFG